MNHSNLSLKKVAENTYIFFMQNTFDILSTLLEYLLLSFEKHDRNVEFFYYSSHTNKPKYKEYFRGGIGISFLYVSKSLLDLTGGGSLLLFSP